MTDSMAEIVDLPSAERRARQPRARYGERSLIVCDGLVKIYKVADLEVVALQGLDLLVEPGELVALVGASGSRQEHAPQRPRRARRAIGRAGRRGRPPAGGARPAGTDALPAPGDRLRLAADAPQPAAVPERARERRTADGVRRGPGRDRGTRARELLRQVGLERSGRPPAAAPVRRRAAAGGDRRGPGQRARGPPRRRADGRARHRHRGRHLRAAPAAQRRARA